MFKYIAGEWAAAKDATIVLPSVKTRVRVVISCATTVSIFLVDQEGELFPVKHGTEFTWNAQVIGYEQIRIKATKEFGYQVIVNGEQIEEPTDDVPVVRPEASDNLVRQIRKRAMQERDRGPRIEFMETENGLPGYSIPEEEDNADLVLFEEDLAEIEKAVRDELAKAEKSPEEQTPVSPVEPAQNGSETGDDPADQNSQVTK